jgi:hypothetical protein
MFYFLSLHFSFVEKKTKEFFGLKNLSEMLLFYLYSQKLGV